MTPRPILKSIVVYFAFFAVFFLTPKPVLANFLDDFSGPLTTNWTAFINNGSITNGNEGLVLATPFGNSFPYIYLSNNIFPDNNYSTEVKFKITGQLTYGAGLVFSDHLLNNNTHNDVGWDDVIFHVWPVSSNTYKVFSNPCPENSVCPQQDSYRGDIATFTDENWHTLKISYSNNIYELFIDENHVFKSGISNKKITKFWIGNPQQTNTNNLWPKLEIAYLKVTANNQTPHPIILIPGFGASWDYGAILKNQDSGNWQIPSWITNYDNIIASFENAGYTKDKDLFIFSYDWRKPLLNLADDLQSYVNSLVTQNKIDQNNKIDFVGHSMGGLVARSYIQKYDTNYTDRIITVGTPHLGTVQAYPAWEGAQVLGFDWYQRSALEILMMVTQDPAVNKVSQIRNLVPSIKDMLPTFDYLFQNGAYRPTSILKQQNIVLDYFNNNTIGIRPLIHASVGNNLETLTRIDVENQTWIDKLLGRWEDGKPKDYLKTYGGDGVVLRNSALGDFYLASELTQNHSDLISSLGGISAIFTDLGLDTSKIETNITTSKSNRVLIALLRSPGEITITDPNGHTLGFGVNQNISYGVYIPAEKMILIPNPSDGNYHITIVPNGETGPYILSVGYSSDSNTNWQNFDGYLDNNSSKQYPFILSNNWIEIDTNMSIVDFRSLADDYLNAMSTQIDRWTGAEKVRGSKQIEIIRRFILNGQLSNAELSIHNLYQLSLKLNHPDVANISLKLLNLLDTWSIKLNSTKPINMQVVNRLKNITQSLKNTCENKLKQKSSSNNLFTYDTANTIWNKAQDSTSLNSSFVWFESAQLWYKDCISF